MLCYKFGLCTVSQKNWTAMITSPILSVYWLFLVERDLIQFSIDRLKSFKIRLEPAAQLP